MKFSDNSLTNSGDWCCWVGGSFTTLKGKTGSPKEKMALKILVFTERIVWQFWWIERIQQKNCLIPLGSMGLVYIYIYTLYTNWVYQRNAEAMDGYDRDSFISFPQFLQKVIINSYTLRILGMSCQNHQFQVFRGVIRRVWCFNRRGQDS